jgi:uncharacterized protein (DUF111 family)
MLLDPDGIPHSQLAQGTREHFVTILFYDCFAGISGDMSQGSLLDLGVDEDALRKGLARLGLEGYDLRVGPDRRGGISGTRAEVAIKGGADRPARHLRAVRELIARFGPVPVKAAVQPDGTRRVKPEYDACRTIALEHGLPPRDLYRELERLLEEEKNGE